MAITVDIHPVSLMDSITANAPGILPPFWADIQDLSDRANDALQDDFSTANTWRDILYTLAGETEDITQDIQSQAEEWKALAELAYKIAENMETYVGELDTWTGQLVNHVNEYPMDDNGKDVEDPMDEEVQDWFNAIDIDLPVPDDYDVLN